jgi:hypothetical protein
MFPMNEGVDKTKTTNKWNKVETIINDIMRGV